LRTQALAKPEVGDFLTKNFVSVHDKVGTFQVKVGSDGKTPNRNGGNVAAFFCTPTGYVIHVAAGPRTAEAFLAEAKWAVAVYSQIMSDRSLGAAQARADQIPRVTAALRQAHSQAHDLLNKPDQNVPGRELVLHEPPSDPKLKGLDDASRNQRKQVHKLFKTRAYEPLATIGPKVYTDILGEKVTNQDVQLSGAPEAKQAARTGQSLREFFDAGGSAGVSPPPAPDPAKTKTALPKDSKGEKRPWGGGQR
jgi:hypothetical protein